MDLSGVITNSFADLLSNPKALVPSLIVSFVILVAAAIVIFGIASGFGYSIGHLAFTPVSYNASGTPAVVSSILNAFSKMYGVIVLLAVITVISFIVSILLNGTIIAMGDQIYRKVPVNISKAFAFARSRYLSLFGAGIFMSAITLLVIGAAALGIFAAFSSLGGFTGILCTIFIVITAICTFIFTSILFFQINVAIILEGKGMVAGLRRSFEIASRNKINIFAILIITSVVVFAAELIGTFFLIIPILGWIISMLMGLFIFVWISIVPVYFYRGIIAQGRVDVNNSKQRITKRNM